MTKKEYCINNKAVAYYSGLNGLEINGIEYGINNYIYCTSGAWNGKKRYHRLKINYSIDGNSFIYLHGYKISLNECIKI